MMLYTWIFVELCFLFFFGCCCCTHVLFTSSVSVDSFVQVVLNRFWFIVFIFLLKPQDHPHASFKSQCIYLSCAVSVYSCFIWHFQVTFIKLFLNNYVRQFHIFRPDAMVMTDHPCRRAYTEQRKTAHFTELWMIIPSNINEYFIFTPSNICLLQASQCYQMNK
jgi:hypothetical protein